MNMPTISLVVPVFNEEETIPLFYATVRNYAEFHNVSVEIVFINDGSSDGTEALLDALSKTDPLVQALSFTRNFGKEAALFAGLSHARGDAVIPIDVDLQDPVEVIPQLIAEWRNGAEIVLAKRTDRRSDSFLKRESAKLFYKLHNKISSPRIEPDVGDFRLLDRSVVDIIKNMPERNIFMKGILSWCGGRTEIVPYARQKRSAGSTKFNAWKLWNLAIEGITSFSTLPLRIWTYIGIFVSALSLFYCLFIVIKYLISGNDVPGYSSLIASITFLAGIQLIGIGILGEYIGRIYMETKHRPLYILKQKKRDTNDTAR